MATCKVIIEITCITLDEYNRYKSKFKAAETTHGLAMVSEDEKNFKLIYEQTSNV